jgi:hypothetical protein
MQDVRSGHPLPRRLAPAITHIGNGPKADLSTMFLGAVAVIVLQIASRQR